MSNWALAEHEERLREVAPLREMLPIAAQEEFDDLLRDAREKALDVQPRPVLIELLRQHYIPFDCPPHLAYLHRANPRFWELHAAKSGLICDPHHTRSLHRMYLGELEYIHDLVSTGTPIQEAFEKLRELARKAEVSALLADTEKTKRARRRLRHFGRHIDD